MKYFALGDNRYPYSYLPATHGWPTPHTSLIVLSAHYDKFFFVGKDHCCKRSEEFGARPTTYTAYADDDHVTIAQFVEKIEWYRKVHKEERFPCLTCPLTETCGEPVKPAL